MWQRDMKRYGGPAVKTFIWSPRPRLWSRGLRFGGQTKAALCAAAEECSEKSVLDPQTAAYLIESAARPVHLFRLPPALARPDPDSPAAAADTDSSSRCRRGPTWRIRRKTEEEERRRAFCLPLSHVFLGVKEMWLM